jgi:hypothetical protein
MENFFNYISKPLTPEDVDVWFRVNNMIPEKMELYFDFAHSLNILILETYLGENDLPNETKIILTENDNKKHFEWCWDKIISNFKQEGINFHSNGEHYDYFYEFFTEVFYHQKNEKVRSSIGKFFKELFNVKKSFTKSDIDMVSTIYKVLDKNVKK